MPAMHGLYDFVDFNEAALCRMRKACQGRRYLLPVGHFNEAALCRMRKVKAAIGE